MTKPFQVAASSLKFVIITILNVEVMPLAVQADIVLNQRCVTGSVLNLLFTLIQVKVCIDLVTS